MVNHTPAIVNCIVPGCGNTSISCPEKTFFCVSNDEERYQHWLLVCRREDILHKVNGHHQFAVCSDHFVEDHFENKSFTTLKDNAVPTIFPSSIQDFYYQSSFNINEASVVLVKPEDSDDGSSDNESDFNNLENYNTTQNVHRFCRLCANVTDNVVFLFSSDGQDLNLAKKINTSLPVTVHRSDPLPKQLCSECVVKVNMCYEFAELCLVAEEKLIALLKSRTFLADHLNNMKPVPDIVTPEFGENFSSITVVEGGSDFTDNKSVINVRSKCENVRSILGSFDNRYDEDEILLFSCPLCPDGVVSVQDHSSHSAENGNDSKECNQNNDIFSTGLNSSNADHKTLVISGSVEQCEESAAPCDAPFFDMPCNLHGNNSNCANGEENTWWSANNSHIIDSTENNSVKNKIPDNSQTVANSNEMSILCCSICQEPFESLGLCLNHSKIHFDEGSYPCTVCNKFFSSLSDHTQHSREHVLTTKQFNYKGKRLKCDFCERRFNTQRTYMNHSCVSSDPKQFRCDVCKKSFGTHERLIFHQKFHEGARINYCDQCGKEFDNEGSLYYHTRMVHEGERPFSCNLCSKKFYSNSRLVAHKRVHTGERPFQCEVCGRRFYDRDTLKGHYVTHMAMKPFQCDFCGVCWGRKSLLNQHIRTHHSDDNGSRRVQSLIHYYCKICDVTFTSSTDVLMHRTTHWKASPSKDKSKSNVHVCEYCDESFSLVTLLVKHRKQKHPDERPYVCSLCKISSHTLYEARLHRNIHSNTKEVKAEDPKEEESSFVCESCGNIFSEKRRFMRHMREHKASLSFKCQTCGKQFIDSQRLTVHTRLHTGEKPFTCNVCGKKFSQTSALYTHALLHTGEKPHSCDLCGKAFRIKADRDNHRRTHTGEKPYKCEFCEKTFRTGQVYYQHRMIHTGERRFPCNICGKAFKRSHTLVVHKRIHTGEKPNICDVCGKGFRQRSDMRKHRALHTTAD